MTLQETMTALEFMGTEQNRKVYARHGMTGSTYGVSFANLGKLKKKIGTDHQLAVRLWKTGNADACHLALQIADPRQMRSGDLDAWVNDIPYYLLGDLLSVLVWKTSFARQKMTRWTRSKQEFTAQVGWNLVGCCALHDADLPDGHFEGLLAVIEREIHQAKNRVKHAMNGVLIAIGIRNARLEKLALAAAARIGKVEVDHGETSCKTPDAAAYIRKAAARNKGVNRKGKR